MADSRNPLTQVTELVRKCLEEGFPVEIDGLGVFRKGEDGGIEFLVDVRPKVFIAYVEEDLCSARALVKALERHGLDPWIDKQKLMPGQNWPRSIERTIEISDFFIALFSKRGMGKRGYFHSELRFALDCASRLPLGDIFLIPARLDDCRVPGQVARQIQYVDLFPSWEDGVARILAVMRKAMKAKRRYAAWRDCPDC